jgi:PAS domain-containing protein
MHQARADVVPELHDPFVIIDASLSVQAMSWAAERILGVPENDVVNRHVTDLLLPADVEANDPSGLAPAITRAACGDSESSSVFVRPVATFGVRLRARIVACGPPRAALVVFET